MGIIGTKKIFHIKPWLNDDPQTVNTLKKNLGISAASQVPEIGSGDNGKFLQASVSGQTKSTAWSEVSQLPEIGSGDNGKFLQASVVGQTKSAVWVTIPAANGVDF